LDEGAFFDFFGAAVGDFFRVAAARRASRSFFFVWPLRRRIFCE
jgi:hypothetical protein